MVKSRNQGYIRAAAEWPICNMSYQMSRLDYQKHEPYLIQLLVQQKNITLLTENHKLSTGLSVASWCKFPSSSYNAAIYVIRSICHFIKF